MRFAALDLVSGLQEPLDAAEAAEEVVAVEAWRDAEVLARLVGVDSRLW